MGSRYLACWWQAAVLGAPLVRILYALSLLQVAAGASLIVGGNSGWHPPAFGTRFPTLRATVGDQLVFDWEAGNSSLVTLRQASCSDVQSGVELANASVGHATVPLNQAGSFHFTSGLEGQCAAGLLLKVVVMEANSDTADSRKDSRLETLGSLLRPGTGHCMAPVSDVSDAGLYTIACYSPGITLRPGQVEDAFFQLPNPYPEDAKVARVKQTSTFVDVTGREVPLSEVYLHHAFDAADFVQSEGAEFRGASLQQAALAPYFTIVNGSDFITNASRVMNIHVISTWGVASESVQRCIECWCSDDESRLSGRHGGGRCCSSALCPSSIPSTSARTYYLQYNITYRHLTPELAVQPVTQYMMDVANGSIEYDVVAVPGGPGPSRLSLTGPLDARCPQARPFRLLRCLGHQHIGGRCMRMVANATGEELCSSCARYGRGPRDQPGDEAGFLVAMGQEVLPEPREVQPGTVVTVTSEYENASHFGVMALWFLDLAGFDTSCPGAKDLAGSAFGPDYAHHAGTAFGAYAGDGFLGGSSEDEDAPANTERQGDAGGRLSLLLVVSITAAAVCVLSASAAAFAGWKILQSRRAVYHRIVDSDNRQGATIEAGGFSRSSSR